MLSLNTIEYNNFYLLDVFNKEEQLEYLYLNKSFEKSSQNDVYFLKLFMNLPTGNKYLLGYLYFYVDILNKKSKFIGTCVKKEFRNQGIASLLISNWIKFCLDNNIEFLETNRKQGKPFILHLLKSFSFEIKNPIDYFTNPYTIYICKRLGENEKLLLFKSKNQQFNFKKSRLYTSNVDEYNIVDEFSDDLTIIDNIILNKLHNLTNNEEGYKRALKIYNKNKF